MPELAANLQRAATNLSCASSRLACSSACLFRSSSSALSRSRFPRPVPVNTGVKTRASARTNDIEAPDPTAVDRYLYGLRVACRWWRRCPWVVGVLRDITAQASQRPFLRARSGWCWFLTARLGGHDDGAIPSIRGGIEVALPIEDLVREAFAALSRGDLDWLQRQYLAHDIRCHFPGGAPWPGTTRAYLRRWGSLAGPSSSQAAHSVLRCAMCSPATSTPSRWPRSTADGPGRRRERHGVF